MEPGDMVGVVLFDLTQVLRQLSLDLGMFMKLLPFLEVSKEINPYEIVLIKIHGILNKRLGSSNINRCSIPRRIDNEEARMHE